MTRSSRRERSPLATVGVLREIAQPYRGRIALLAAVSAAATTAEAGVLALIASSAAALADQRRTVTIPLTDDTLTLRSIALVGVVLLVGLVVARTAIAYGTAAIARRSLEQARVDLIREYVSGPWDSLVLEQEGDLQTLLVSNSTRLAQTIVALTTALTASLGLVVLLVAAFAISPFTSAVVCVVVLAAFGALRPLSRASMTAGGRLSAANLVFGRFLTQLQNNILEVQSLGVEKQVIDDARNKIDDIGRPFSAQIRYASIAGILFQYSLLLLVLLGLLVAGETTDLSIASMGAVVLVMLRAASFGQQVQSATQQIAQYLPQVRDINAMRHRLTSTHADLQNVQCAEVSVGRIETIEVVGVTYDHPDGTRALTDVSFEMRRSEALGVVGASGAGKTTLLRLLLKLAEPSGGRIDVDGVDLSTISLVDWRRLMSFVPQQPQLLMASLADNVRYYRGLDHRR